MKKELKKLSPIEKMLLIGIGFNLLLSPFGLGEEYQHKNPDSYTIEYDHYQSKTINPLS